MTNKCLQRRHSSYAGFHLVSPKTGVTQKSASLKKLFAIQHKGACFSISQSLFIDAILTASHDATGCGKQKTCFSLRACFCGDRHLNQLVLFQTASLNSNRTCRWGNRHIADMHWEPAFPLVLEFPLLTVGGATRLAALVVLLVLLCSSLGPDGPPGSSCYCAGPRQKPCVSSSTEHQRKPPWSCRGSGISRGIKGGTVLIWRLFFFFFTSS